MRIYFLYCLLACLNMMQAVRAQTPLTSVGSWNLTPQYSLERKAANLPGPVQPLPQVYKEKVAAPSYPLLFHGEAPTERIHPLLPPDSLPTTTFSVECWLLDHVNQPVGALLTCKDKYEPAEPDWLLGYYDGDVLFTLATEDSPDGTLLHAEVEDGWKEHWHHLVATYDGQQMQLYHNGTLLRQTAVEQRLTGRLPNPELELAAYLQNEPYMQTGNLLRQVQLYNEALDQEQVAQRYQALQQEVEQGILYPGLFHFNAGPYLHYSTQTSINMVWETDRPATALLTYGTQLPLTQLLSIDKPRTLQETTLDGLEPETSYFYQIQAVSAQGDTIRSGMLTFSTAVRDSAAFAFALIGDTEARAHINDRMAGLLWDERPNFVLNLGDLTDGGFREHKYQWNYEYFAGTRSLHSRIPVFPVAGNGEEDLYWYKRYHKLPGTEAYYSFRYGNAEFFMLNSNEKRREFAPGGRQYVWLDSALTHSSATWKFVAHHHAPYTADDDDYGNAWEGKSELGDQEVRQLVPLFEKHGVDMVFFGHLHTYQRTLPIANNRISRKRGVIYIQCGGGGGNLEDFAPARAWFSAKTYRGHHYAILQIHDRQLSYKVYDAEGRMKDFLEVDK